MQLCLCYTIIKLCVSKGEEQNKMYCVDLFTNPLLCWEEKKRPLIVFFLICVNVGNKLHYVQLWRKKLFLMRKSSLTGIKKF
jgi:hypothetical protein